jgi:hypothetical protein
MNDEELLASMPKVCSFCSLGASDSNKLHICVRVDDECHTHMGALCESCFRRFLFALAHEDRDKFEALIKEARERKSGKPDSKKPE